MEYLVSSLKGPLDNLADKKIIGNIYAIKSLKWRIECNQARVYLEADFLNFAPNVIRARFIHVN